MRANPTTTVRFPAEVKEYCQKMGVLKQRTFSAQVIWMIREQMKKEPLRGKVKSPKK